MSRRMEKPGWRREQMQTLSRVSLALANGGEKGLNDLDLEFFLGDNP
jgi:hypothetical protein